jgi:hypothetical protein
MGGDSQRENLERDVAEERARVDATLDEVQRRLTPGQLIDEVLHHGRGAGSDFVANLGRTLAANPIPTALVGVGLMWLLLAPKPTTAITTKTGPTASDASNTEV